MNFLQNPNLPSARVSLAAVQNEAYLTEALKKQGISLVSPEKNDSLSPEISGHADMLLLHTGDKNIFLEPSQKNLAATLKSLGFETRFSRPLSEKYPRDIVLNIAVGENFAAGLLEYNDDKALEELKRSGKKLIPVKQGYSKCSICFLREKAVITEDGGIAKVLSAEGIDVLLISKGDIILSASHYGFLGGCSGKTDKNTLAINGSLEFHRDGERIREFAKKHAVKILQLGNYPLRDIGGILPLCEEMN